MNYRSVYERWSRASRAAREAEEQIYRAIEDSRASGGAPPAPQELAEARRLRQVASRYLHAVMTEIWRK